MAGELSADDMRNVQATLMSQNLGNRADIEMQWAIKAHDHADVYFNLISSVDPSVLRLTKLDDEIYSTFREYFPDMKVDVIKEGDLKTEEGKKSWREFVEKFKGRVEDFNFGTLLRLDCKLGYTEENCTLSIRTQFLAIEIARNREKHNDSLRYTHGKLKGSEEKAS